MKRGVELGKATFSTFEGNMKVNRIIQIQGDWGDGLWDKSADETETGRVAQGPSGGGQRKGEGKGGDRE